MAFVFRTMIIDGEGPAVGPTGKTLGVRVPPADWADIPIDSNGNVSPNTGGMSVAPAWRALRSYQIPKRLRHFAPGATVSDKLACWRLGETQFADGSVADGLQLRINSPKHGTMEPVEVVPIETFQADLAATRDRWIIDES